MTLPVNVAALGSFEENRDVLRITRVAVDKNLILQAGAGIMMRTFRASDIVANCSFPEAFLPMVIFFLLLIWR